MPTIHIELDIEYRQLAAVDVSEGWYAVKVGAVKPGDRYLDRLAFQDGVLCWGEAYPPEKGQNGAEWYMLLIRRGTVPGGAYTCKRWRERKPDCRGRCKAGEVICERCVAWLIAEGWTVKTVGTES